MTRPIKVMLIYSASALMGPLLRLATWPPLSSKHEALIYDIVLLLWPTQMFAVMENSIGRTGALLVAISMNVMLFVVMGLIVAAARKKSYIIFTSSSVIIAIVVLALWGAGFNYANLNAYALLLSIAFYSLLLYITTIISPPRRR